MVKHLAFWQDVHSIRAARRLGVKGPKEGLAVLAQQPPDGKAGEAGHKGCVNGEAHSETQQGVHGGVCFKMKPQVWVKARSKTANA